MRKIGNKIIESKIEEVIKLAIEQIPDFREYSIFIVLWEDNDFKVECRCGESCDCVCVCAYHNSKSEYYYKEIINGKYQEKKILCQSI